MAKIKTKSQLRSRIVQVLRKLSWSWHPLQEAERDAQVDKALIECNHCSCLIYKGKSEKNFQEYIEKYPDNKLIMGTIYRDHIDPVIEVGKRTKDLTLDTIVDRMFCGKSNIQMLCFDCHEKKTEEENSRR